MLDAPLPWPAQGGLSLSQGGQGLLPYLVQEDLNTSLELLGAAWPGPAQGVQSLPQGGHGLFPCPTQGCQSMYVSGGPRFIAMVPCSGLSSGCGSIVSRESCSEGSGLTGVFPCSGFSFSCEPDASGSGYPGCVSRSSWSWLQDTFVWDSLYTV